MQCKAICLTICSWWLITAAPVNALQICGVPQQGGFVKVQADNLDRILLNGKTYKADKNGRLALAFGRNADLQQNLKIFYKDGKNEEKNLALQAIEWNVQKINGIPQAKVTPTANDEKEIEKEQRAVADGLRSFSEFEYWDDKMSAPVEGRTSGVFGSQRIMNGVKKNPHRGWDIAAPEGTEVVAMAGGVVTLADGPFFYSGNMVIVEHGQNLSTIYAHLQKIFVKHGDKVAKGEVIGLVGKTGRVTGPHLHLGASLNNVRFDAQTMLNFDENNCMNL